MTVTTSNARHLLFRIDDGARLPDALLGNLRDEVVLSGWMRASGILHDVRIRTLGGSGVRALTGAVHAIVLEGSIGLAQGDVTCGLRAVLARETDSGLETIAGEIVEARVGALEVMVTALDDVTAARAPGAAGVWLLDLANATVAAPRPAPVAAAPPPAPVAAAPAPVAAAPTPAPVTPSAPVVAPARVSEPEPPRATPTNPPRPSPTFTATAMPTRPAKPVVVEEEHIYPDAGDVVEHFAFGRCEVVKSDGDRLHLRLGKDGRVKEIALEMLRVTPLPAVEGSAGKHYKLDRKL
jgi:predicted DNA-binding protein with PD1-like motif